MILKKTPFLDIISSITTPNKTKSFFLILILLPSFFVSTGIQSLNNASASPNLGDSLDQFQNNLQSNIEEQIQSSTNNNNNNNNVNCDSNNNFSIQSQTNNNGETTSTSRTSCGVSTSTTSSISSSDVNLNGTIVSTEYNTTTGIIINSLFGNWSLRTTDGNSNVFNSSFTKQPVFYNSNNAVISNSSPDTSINNVLAPNANANTNSIAPNANANNFTDSKNNEAIPSVSSLRTGFSNQTQSIVENQQDSNLTSYNLSNFRVNSINQQNFDITYQGIIDVVKEVQSLDTNRPDETNTFKDINTSISILDNRTLVINFDNQTKLFDEFKNIPLVGIVR